jgi:hypothetical protein
MKKLRVRVLCVGLLAAFAFSINIALAEEGVGPAGNVLPRLPGIGDVLPRLPGFDVLVPGQTFGPRTVQVTDIVPDDGWSKNIVALGSGNLNFTIAKTDSVFQVLGLVGVGWDIGGLLPIFFWDSQATPGSVGGSAPVINGAVVFVMGGLVYTPPDQTAFPQDLRVSYNFSE